MPSHPGYPSLGGEGFNDNGVKYYRISLYEYTECWKLMNDKIPGVHYYTFFTRVVGGQAWPPHNRL